MSLEARSENSPTPMSAGYREPYVTAEEAAVFLGVRPITVKRMARANRLPAYAIGNGPRKRWRFRISELASHMSFRAEPGISSVLAVRRKNS